jgi:hypothetical protein
MASESWLAACCFGWLQNKNLHTASKNNNNDMLTTNEGPKLLNGAGAGIACIQHHAQCYTSA